MFINRLKMFTNRLKMARMSVEHLPHLCVHSALELAAVLPCESGEDNYVSDHHDDEDDKQRIIETHSPSNFDGNTLDSTHDGQTSFWTGSNVSFGCLQQC